MKEEATAICDNFSKQMAMLEEAEFDKQARDLKNLLSMAGLELDLPEP